MTKAYTNAEWKIILGEDTYENMLDMLSKGKFFNHYSRTSYFPSWIVCVRNAAT